VLYECLTGGVPYGAEVGGVILREHDEPPAFPPDFPGPLRATVETCLRLSPDDRFESVHELLEDLGQTARQGDSVRLPWAGGSGGPGSPGGPLADAPTAGGLGSFARSADAPTPAAPAGGEGSDETPRRPTPTSFGRDDLRQAAGELARGAVGVARGVWDGVRGRGADRDADRDAGRGASESDDPSAPTAPDSSPGPESGSPGEATGEETPRAGGSFGHDIVSVRTLAESDDEPRAPYAAGPSSTPAPARGPARGAELAVGGPLSPAGGTAALAIPVPPRESGGAIGAIASTAVLGAEILATLVTGPVLALLRGLRGGVDGVLQRLPGAFGAIVRLVLFVLVCFSLGAAAALVILGALMGGNPYIQ